MIKRVMTDSFKLASIAVDFAINKVGLDATERNTMRHAGTWIGIMTLQRSKPILQKELDLKNKMYESMENHSVGNVIPIVCSILKTTETSSIFKSTNPYIMGCGI